MKTLALPMILLTIICLSISSCKKKNDDDDCIDGSNNFKCLSVNRSVTYAFDMLFYDYDTATFTVAEDLGNGKRKLNIDSRKNNESGYFASPQYWQACGNDLYSGLTTDLTSAHWWISLNSNVGDKWKRINNGVTNNYELLSKNETVIVPAGTFSNCLKITYNQSGTINTDTFYFHPEISLVKYDGFMFSYELISKNF